MGGRSSRDPWAPACNLHPFVDGKKRVAFFVTDVFLRLNGFKLEVDPDEAHELLIGLLEHGSCGFDHLLPWIRASLARI
jgi:death-on-curing protein